MDTEDLPQDDEMHGRPCPLCKDADSVRRVDGPEHHRTVACASCGAKWEIMRAPPPGPMPLRPRLRGRVMRMQPILAKLVEPGNTEEGKRLLGTTRPLRFWRQLSGFGPAQVGPTQVIREVVKIRCKYCSNIYDLSQGECPNCGAPP